ncbi:hypothetical protein [Clostridium estertheticum]|nr:hypothetical protein [Clostridium estertheticum]
MLWYDSDEVDVTNLYEDISTNEKFQEIWMKTFNEKYFIMD